METAKLDTAFTDGNYMKVRSLSRKIIKSKDATAADKKKAALLLFRTGIDPVVIWVGIATTLFVSLVAYLVTK